MIWPHPILEQRWTESRYGGEGNAQPWVQLLLYSLVRCISAREVIEFGSFRGATTAWLALAVAEGTLTRLRTFLPSAASGADLAKAVALVNAKARHHV